jgi:hypothetical protein
LAVSLKFCRFSSAAARLGAERNPSVCASMYAIPRLDRATASSIGELLARNSWAIAACRAMKT